MRCITAFLLLILIASCSSPTATRAPAASRFADTDPSDWSGVTPHHYAVHGIDVSRYQGAIDWRRVRNSGVSFAFIKATEGGDFLDPRFRDNWTNARRAGVPRGAYHFYYFCRSAREQADWFIANVPRDRAALPAVLDVEWNHASRTCRYRPAPDVVRKEMRVFLNRLTRHYGQRPVIYSTVDFFDQNGLSRLKGYDFWLRSVAGHPSQVYPNQSWAFWQYTGTGVVPGISGPTDINVFAGTRSQWRQWMARRSG